MTLAARPPREAGPAPADGLEAAPSGGELRRLVLLLLVGGGVAVVAVTEGLGAARALRPGPVLVAWVSIAAVALLVLRRSTRGRAARGRGPSPLDGTIAAGVALVAALTLLAALTAAPTTWDSMTYHLPRVAHWEQDRSVAFYPTQIIRQLYQPPWAEYAVLQLYLLTGGDRLANLVQWLAMAGCLAGTSLVARELGASPRGQLLAAFVVATIPMGILQASNTKNDYAAALWLVCLAYALLAARSATRWVWVAGASLGLALLTKGTAYVYGPALLPLFLWSVGPAWRVAPGRLLAVLGLAALLNAPHGWRNAETFGSVLGPGGEGGGYTYANSELSPRVLAANAIRNVALHAGTPSSRVNEALQVTVDGALGRLGMAPDDPRSTWPGTRLTVTRPSSHEDLAGNGLHLLLLGASMAPALLWARNPRGGMRLAAYAAGPVAGFLLFSLLLKWQPWHSRLQLPLVVLGAPVAGLLLERARGPVVAAVVLALAATSAEPLVASASRPLLGPHSVLRQTRDEQVLAHANAVRPAYVEAARLVRASGCRTVGLAIGPNDPEYVIWRFLEGPGQRLRVDHHLVFNPSRDIPTGVARAPCSIIADSPLGAAALSAEAGAYRVASARGTVKVLLATHAPAPRAVAGGTAAWARVALARTHFKPGDRLTLGIDVGNPRSGPAADLLVGFRLPDGKSAVFVTGLGWSPITPLERTSGFPPGRPAPPGFRLDDPAFLDFDIPHEGTVEGTYWAFAMLVRREGLADDRIDPEDVLAEDARAFTFRR